ncbi:hypothetical protein N0V88_006038 [Collariella sp. IMI 366227]|nr:hypothetical protein N0V88_006038 [Collariella sp. IMI 366227]
MLVIISYLTFVIGCAIVGMGQTMWQVILGRVISGAGASGMGGLVSVLITDLLPVREVAQWRAFVNLVATLGRSIGGPLDISPNSNAVVTSESSSLNQKSKFSRIDFKGSILFALTVLALLLPIELGGVQIPWTHPIILSLFSLSVVLLFVFIAVEKRQEEPILPLEIFHSRDAVFSFMILGLQTAAQSGRYKTLIILAVALSSFSYLLLMLRWHGNTNWWESLYIFPGNGLGTGIAQSAVFISLQAVIGHSNPSHLAPAITFMYLCMTLSVTVGLPTANAVMQSALKITLGRRLEGLGIIESTISDVNFIDRVTGSVREAIVASYVDGLWWSHGVSFLFSITAFVLAVFIKQRPLDGPRA